ncbi:MAG: DUF262 domain-containing protein [Erysipelotrichia bacterium]|jgi:hypothetical protein|nr:DUF262 domain-containing protein [Erysipelotrichia bacterium]
MEEEDKEELIVTSCSLADLLNCSSSILPNTEVKGQLSIPEYQRPYVWSEKQINTLLDDWLEYSKRDNPKPLFYLGSIILHNDNGRLNIIDGQQRITTALMFQLFKNDKIITNITHHNPESISNIKNNLPYLKAIKNRLIFDYSEQDILNSIDFTQINVTLVITNSEDLAYTFFETQNTGGVRLKGSDILKAHHLRAVPERKLVNYQARKWEASDNKKVEHIIQQLTKVRFWDNRHWLRFPFYRDSKGIKQSITDEFTLKTKSDGKDVSFHYSAVVKEGDRRSQMHQSDYKMLKQPLSDGANTLDYINDYIELYNLLFQSKSHHLIDDRFYDFREKLIIGNNGTIFLKELFEVSIISYVSRFGFYLIFEASLWLFRAIYSLRVSNARNVREDSVFKFVYDNQFIDNILEVFTTEELFLYLKKLRYNFDTSYLVKDDVEMNTVKTRFIKDVTDYFNIKDRTAKYYAENSQNKSYDNDLMTSINRMIDNGNK